MEPSAVTGVLGGARSLLVPAVRVAASGRAPAGEVWDRYTRPALWPGWAPHLRRVDYGHDVVRAGTAGRVVGVGGVVATFRIDDVDPATHRWAWSVRTGPLRVRFEHGVDVDAGGTTTAWVVTHGLAPVAVGYAPLARWAMTRLVRDGG